MSSEGISLVLQGRIVWCAGGNPFVGVQKKDQAGKLLTNDKGEPAMQYGFGLAVPKPAADSRPEEVKNFMDMWEAMHKEAMSLYPTGSIPPGFSMKYKDGDGVDHNGQPFANREGYKGCLVFALTTSLPIKFFKYEGAYVQVSDGIKCGDYVQVQVSIKGHLPKMGTQGKPGLYLNPGLTLLLAPGKEIVNTPSADAVFGAQAPKAVFNIPAYEAPQSFGQLGQPQVAPQAPAAPAWGGQANPAVLPPQFQQQSQAAPQMPAVPAWGGQQPAVNPGVPNFAPQAPMGNGFTPSPGFVQPAQQVNTTYPGQVVQQPVNPASPFNQPAGNGFPFPQR